MAVVRRGRHIGYTSSGIPIIRELPSDICLPGPTDQPTAARHVRYTSSGMPIVINTLKCCGVYREDRVQEACWTPGITDMVALRTESFNCLSAKNKLTLLTYNVLTEIWEGSLALRGCTLTVEFSCDETKAENDPDKFRLVFKNGMTTVADLLAGFDCDVPLFIQFAQFITEECCDCFGIAPGEIHPRIEANCFKTVWARHIDYTADGTPIVAQENCKEEEDDGPCSPTCDLTAIIAGCANLAGTWDLPYIGATPPAQEWENAGCGVGAVGTITMTCEDNGDGTVDLHVQVTCGANDTGGATITIPKEDLDTLDETFNVTMSGPSGDCGTCLFHWDDMAQSWILDEDNCLGDEGCGECVEPEGTSSEPDERETDCEGTITVCCQGAITVRVMR